MRGLPSILSLFQKFNKFNNIGAQMLDSILSYDLKTNCKSHYCMERAKIMSFIPDVILDLII